MRRNGKHLPRPESHELKTLLKESVGPFSFINQFSKYPAQQLTATKPHGVSCTCDCFVPAYKFKFKS